jgi:hypothetical protein
LLKMKGWSLPIFPVNPLNFYRNHGAFLEPTRRHRANPRRASHGLPSRSEYITSLAKPASEATSASRLSKGVDVRVDQVVHIEFQV